MAKNGRSESVSVDSIPEGSLQAFRRSQWFEDAKTYIQIFLMWVFAIGLVVFMLLTFGVGVAQYMFPDNEGTRALAHLFSEIALNAKAVFLFALGFYFREYINAKNTSR